MNFPSFEEFAELVRTSAGFAPKQRIDPDTQLLRDLRLNEKKAISVGTAIEQRFGIRLSPEIHKHLQDVGSFQYQDSDKDPVIQPLFGSAKSAAHSWTAGWLYRAILEEISQLPPQAVVRQ